MLTLDITYAIFSTPNELSILYILVSVLFHFKV